MNQPTVSSSEQFVVPKEDDVVPHVETSHTEETQKDIPLEHPLTHVTLKNIFRHPDSHPVALDLLLLLKYGPEWLLWEPETISLRIPQDFGTGEVSHRNFHKIQACKAMHLVDTFWQRWEVFGWCSMALSGFAPNMEVMQVPSVSVATNAIFTANQLRDDVEWSTEVKSYLESALRFDGLLFPLAPFDFLSIPAEEFPVDAEDVRKRWLDVARTGHVPSEETVENEQLRRMLRVKREMSMLESQLDQQRRLVEHAQ